MKTVDIDKLCEVLDTFPPETVITAKIFRAAVQKAMGEEKENEKVLVLDEEF